MEYSRARYEEIRDGEDNVKEIFISVRLTVSGDTWEQGYWLTEQERDAVLSDESALNTIAFQTAARGEIALANYKASPPQEEPVE